MSEKMLVQGWICPLDFGTVLVLVFILCVTSVAILLQLANAGKTSSKTSKCTPAETTNKTTVHGDGNITVSTGSDSTITITTVTYPQYVQKEDRSTETRPGYDKYSSSLVPLVPKPVGKPQRQNAKTLNTCYKLIDNLAKLSTEGKILQCHAVITKLMKTKTDPDSQVSLRHAASFNAINEGDVAKANRLLHEVTAFLPKTKHETEHRLWWGRLKSLAKIREGNCEVGIVFAKETLPLLEAVPPGGMTGWVLLNHARLITEIATSQDDEDDRRLLTKMAERDFQHAIEHTEYEHPRHMLHSQSRVPQFAKIGLAFLYLRCRVTVDAFKLGGSGISLEDIQKAKNVIAALEKETMVCNSSRFWLMMAKTCLHYRLGSYQQAYDLAQEAKGFATKNSFGGFVKFAGSIVQYLQDYV